MKLNVYSSSILIVLSALASSCSLLEKASIHGFHSGYYKESLPHNKAQRVYLDVAENQIDLYSLKNEAPDTNTQVIIPLGPIEGSPAQTRMFSKNSLDIDLTSVIFKYRPAVNGLPPQLTTDFNLAVYAGWRRDSYRVKSKTDPLGRQHTTTSNWGYDAGFFIGPGTTLISPFTTRNQRADEYNAMVIQTGVAAFIESGIASFGLALGYDHLTTSDRRNWIYRDRPWIGFVVGIALN